MHGFRVQRGAYVARLDAAEREVVASVVADVAELLGAGRLEDDDGTQVPADPTDGPLGLTVRTTPLPPPQDPAVRRLLPDASRDDPQVAAEFRRLTEDDLRARKVARLRALWASLVHGAPGWPQDALVVTPDAADDVAAAITDLRLVLGERLGLRTDADSEALYDGLVDAREDDVRAYLGSVYGALSWLQESLLVVMLAAPASPGPGPRRSGG